MKPVNHQKRSSAIGKFITAYSITTFITIAAVAFIFSSFSVVEGESSVSQREVNELHSVLDEMKNTLVKINNALDDGADLNDLFNDLGQIRNSISVKNVYNSSNVPLRSICRDVEIVLINYRSLLNSHNIVRSTLNALQSEDPCEGIQRRYDNLNEDFNRLQGDCDGQLASAQAGGGSRVEERIPDGFVNDFLDVIEKMAGKDNQNTRKGIGRSTINSAKIAGYFNDFSDPEKVSRIQNSLRQ